MNEFSRSRVAGDLVTRVQQSTEHAGVAARGSKQAGAAGHLGHSGPQVGSGWTGAREEDHLHFAQGDSGCDDCPSL